jgi:5-methylcytosine-specific restriction endonuclease McrA
MAKNRGPLDEAKLDQVVAQARRQSEERARGYREQALKLYPWVCGRCAREFTRVNLQELTVHHRDHNHDHNPGDGSNWELLCIYCHDNEHARLLEQLGPAKGQAGGAPVATHQPFAALAGLLGKKGDE